MPTHEDSLSTTSSPSQFSSIGKAIAVMEVLKQFRSGLSVGQTALHAGLAKATTYRILSILEVHQMARRGPSGYMLGERAGQWGLDRNPASELRQGAVPYMIEVLRATGLPVTLATLSGLAVTTVEVIFAEAHRQQVERTEVNGPPHCTAAGKALLAHDPRATDGIMQSVVLNRFTEHTITDRERLSAELHSVRRTGVARARGERVRNLNETAVPVYGRSRRVVAALAVAGFGERPLRTETETELRRAAAAISAVLARQRQFRTASPTS
jgi:DNA-binding IclR family transcriptional regulator